MLAFIRIFGKFLFEIVTLFRKIIWSFKFKKTYKLIVLKGESYLFTRFGDIPRFLFAKQHYVNRKQSFEYDALELYKSFLKPGDIIFDVGANVGLFSLVGSKVVGDNGKIYSFEPARKTFEALNANLLLNQVTNVKTFPIALSDQAGTIELDYPTTNPTKEIDNDAFAFIKKSSKGTIKAVMIDEFFKENNIERLDLIKLDIEGAEYLCLKGAKHTIEKFKPIIIVELVESNCNRFNYTCIDALFYLKELGYNNIKQLNPEMWFAKAY